MKYILFLLLLPTLLFAVEDDLNYPLFEVENAPPPFYAFSISGQYVDVSKTDFRSPGLENSNLIYRQADAAFAYTHPCTEVAGFIFGAGWVGTDVDMKDNPDFNETNFNYINFSVGGYTKAFDPWTWTLTLAAFLDTEEFSFSDYALYQGVLWGKYAFCPYVELDFGLILEVGLNKEKVWPILGFIYTPWDCFKINAVYPINITAEYFWNDAWTLAGSIRFLRNRHRVQKDEPNSQGIFEYRTTGAELDLIYSPLDRLSVKGFAGKTFDGDLKMTNRRDNNGRHFKFDGSFYWGVSGVFSF